MSLFPLWFCRYYVTQKWQYSSQEPQKQHRLWNITSCCSEKSQKNCSDLIPLLCSRSEKCAVTYNYREPSFEPVTAKSMQHKISFPANGTSFNNVKWDCTDFETRPGAIDRLSQWKGSHYFDWEQTIFHSKCEWAVLLFGINSPCIFMFVFAYLHTLMFVYVLHVWAVPVMCLFCSLN